MQHNPALTLTEAARACPGRPHPSTLWRWARKGVRGANGVTVKLEHVRLGARIFTSREAIDCFGRALAEADAQHFNAHQAEPIESGQIQAETELEAAGM